ncbi:glycoside hydrolase family 18 protein [Candidatus Neomarinimicrobiota bacterium]
MRTIQKFNILFIFVMISCQTPVEKKEIIGCYLSWKWQQNQELLNPQNIPYDKLTMINYSFFYPLESGEIVGMDPNADRHLLKGEINKSIIELAKQYGTKVILSIGGWETSNNFPQVSADPKKREIFAHWCVKHIKNYGFDGIDIDWEFPGYKQHNGTSDDKLNFTLLLQTVKDSLKSLENTIGGNYLLTVSLPAAESHLSDLEVTKISSIVDYINIMTYDLHGPWGNISNHNSPLFGPAQGDAARCLDGAFKLYHEVHNVPSEKITLCSVFFGHSYSNCKEIYGIHSGTDTTIFKSGEDILYSHINEKMDLFERYWDFQAQAPYLISKENSTLVSFDDEESVALKSDYIIKNNAGGLTIWPLMGDYLKSGETPLLKVINEKLSI